jgi:hypothetical protein
LLACASYGDHRGCGGDGFLLLSSAGIVGSGNADP